MVRPDDRAMFERFLEHAAEDCVLEEIVGDIAYLRFLEPPPARRFSLELGGFHDKIRDLNEGAREVHGLDDLGPDPDQWGLGLFCVTLEGQVGDTVDDPEDDRERSEDPGFNRIRPGRGPFRWVGAGEASSERSGRRRRRRD